MGIFNRYKDRALSKVPISQGPAAMAPEVSVPRIVFKTGVSIPRVGNYLKANGMHLLSRSEMYLSEQDLQKFKIQLSSLNLKSSRARPTPLYSESYLKPIHSSQVDKWLGSRGGGRVDWVSPGFENMQSTNYGEARDVIRYLGGLLLHESDPVGPGREEEPPILIAHSSWRTHS